MKGITWERFNLKRFFPFNLEKCYRCLTNKLETPVRKHLTRVYTTLTFISLVAAAGGLAHEFNNTRLKAGIFTGICAIGSHVCLTKTPYEESQKLYRKIQRLSLLGSFAFFTGFNLGPLLNLAVAVNPTILLQALLGTTLVFACFSLSALYAPRAHYLYLGSILLSILSTLTALSLMNIFLGSRLIFDMNLYVGLALCCGFIVYDTQIIMEKARGGDRDYVMHSLELFLDFLGVFLRFFIILMEKEMEKKERRKKKQPKMVTGKVKQSTSIF